MNYIVWVGHGDHDTECLPIRGAADPYEAVWFASLIVSAEHDDGTWHVIDVLPVLPMPKGVQ